MPALRRAISCHTEDAYASFSCQQESSASLTRKPGLCAAELDAALLAWGTDLVRDGRRWSTANARGYKLAGNAKVRDPYQLRVNAYRVLLTRGRDCTIVYAPKLRALDVTYEFLTSAGFVPVT